MDRPACCQRTYTLRLAAPADGSGADWRRRLWATHQAVNLGGRVFGDWLLTLRGGLCHSMADASRGPGRKSRHSRTAREARRQRVLLALSWLSLESRSGTALEFAVPVDASGKASTIEALAELLLKRGVAQATILEWLEDCAPALEAAIRPDTLWINRSAMFDALIAGAGERAAREDCRHVLWNLFTDQYLVLPLESGSAADSNSAAAPNAPAAVRAGSSGAGQRTRQLFSYLFGSSANFGGPAERLRLRHFWREHLTVQLARAGMPLDEAPKRGRKRLDDVNRSPSEFHREMFAKAAMRVAQILTKIRRQEANRLHWLEADQKLHELEVKFPVALECLEQYRKHNPSEPIGAEALYSCREWLWRAAHARPQAVRKAATSLADADAAVATLTDDEPADELFSNPSRFHDFNLFWFKGGRASRDKLKTYAEGTSARAGVSQLKAVSYRHPDPYFSPIFCQFGVSRPLVEFDRLADGDDAIAGDHRGIKLLVWDGSQATIQPLRATSKRFDAEIGSAGQSRGGDQVRPAVARRTRLAQLAAGALAAGDSNPRVDHIFEPAAIFVRRKTERKSPVPAPGKMKPPRWNGTLCVDRESLARLGRCAARDPQRAARMIEHGLQWRLKVALDLVPHGPWVDYGRNHALHDTRFDAASGQELIITCANGKQEQWRGLTFPFWHPDNQAATRKGKARQLLARLPGLRVLSVVPGSQRGAACAVWQTLSAAEFQQQCRQLERQGGSIVVQPLWASARVAASDTNGTAGKQRTICFRRLGPDAGADGRPHPACWARLERQFFINLPGEQDDCRRPLAAELSAVERFERELAIARPQAASRRWRGVNALVSYALRLAAQGLRRHATHARIARGLASDPLARGAHAAAAPSVDLVQAIGAWHALAFSDSWPDAMARELWQQHIAKLPLEGELAAMVAGKHEGATALRRLSRDECQQVARLLTPLGRVLARQQWINRWTSDDGRPAEPALALALGSHATKPMGRPAEALSSATGWHARIRWLHDWARGRTSRPARGVGGLSLARLAMLHAAREQVRSFAARPRPDRAESPADNHVAAATTRMLQRKLEDRARQLASRVVEAALGAHAASGGSHTPCHAVVLGTPASAFELSPALSADERVIFGRAARLLRVRLVEACQLHGVHLTAASTRQASRQDARTGLPGIRLEEVEAAALVEPGGRWANHVELARESVEAACQAGRPPAPLDLYWLVLERQARAFVALSPRTAVRGLRLRVPNPHGPLFLPLGESASAGGAINAELNTAASVGIERLADSDWPASWWFVPTAAGRGMQRRPDLGRTKGAACLEDWIVQPVGDGRYAAASLPAAVSSQAAVRRRLVGLLGLTAITEDMPDELPATEPIEQAGASDARPVKRKRGRPRKSAQPGPPPERLNLWRDASAADLAAGVWLEGPRYHRECLARGLARLLDGMSRSGEPSPTSCDARYNQAPLGLRHVGSDLLTASMPSTGGPA